MIELQVIDDSDLGQIMDKLATLIKKCRVVFVALDNEPFAISKSRPLAEIIRDPTNEVTGV